VNWGCGSVVVLFVVIVAAAACPSPRPSSVLRSASTVTPHIQIRRGDAGVTVTNDSDADTFRNCVVTIQGGFRQRDDRDLTPRSRRTFLFANFSTDRGIPLSYGEGSERARQSTELSCIAPDGNHIVLAPR
jgi:hypothetical protein